MKKLVVGMLYAFCALTAVHSGDINAQGTTGTSTTTTSSDGTTANLITSGANHTWTGVTTGTVPAGCATAGPCPGGPTPLYDPATNTVNFSYNANATVAQTIAINNALAGVGAGVKIGGYNYSYDVRNMNGDNRQGGIDTLTVYQSLMGTSGTALLSSQQTYNTKFEWMSVTGTQTAGTPIEQANASYLQFKMVGGDNGYWGGYFGPQVRNVSMSLNYVATPIVQHTMGDDGWINVPLQFGFPFYGKVFTNSFMFDNGVVGFFDPVAGGCNPANGWCGGQQWNSQPFSNNMGNQFSYMIAPLWGDIAPNNNTRYLTQGDATFQKYTWENIGQYYDQSKLQTFDLTIKPSGFIGVNYGQVNLNQTNISVGTIGNSALGEYNQIAFHPAGTTVTGLPNWSMNQTQAADLCVINPLSSPSCPGYTDAMCASNPLYATSCPGYQQAFFTQQCSANPLYNQQCPGYALAYLDLQCSANPLYSTTCQGYQQAQTDCSANPLLHSYCPMYQTATTQCSINPLYGSFCPGYTVADTECSTNPLSHSYCPMYQTATSECSANALYAPYCSGYQAAQSTCSTNPLSNNLCIGYSVASTECTNNPLSHSYCPAYQTSTTQCAASALYAPYCPGYQFAYACQQDGLYSNQCPNYAEAYAKKMLLEQQGLASTVATAGTVAAVAAADPANTVATTSTTTDASSSATSSAISSNPVVASAVSTKSTATTSETNPAAPVKLTATPPAPAQQIAQAEPKKDSGPSPKEEKKEEKKEEGAKQNASGPNNSPSGSDSKPGSGPKTARQELAERRRDAAQKEAVAKGKDLANEMGKASDMESQKAVQNVVIQAMGFTPGFDTYNKAMLPDSRFYAPKIVYGGQVNVDNKNVSRRLMGGSDRVHQDMVDSQYNRGN